MSFSFNFGGSSSTPAASTGSAPASTGFSFGAPAQSSSSSSSTPAAGAGFSFGAPAKSTAAAATGFSFGASKSTASSTPASTGFSFGSTTTSTTKPAATTATKPAASAGFSFGSTSTAATKPATTATPGASNPSFSFGASTTGAASAAGASTGSSSASTGASFSFGNSSTSSGSSSALTTTATSGASKPAATFSFGATTSASSVTASGSTVATTTDTTSAQATLSSRIKNSTVEEIISQWQQDLEEQVQQFTEQALRVREWDELLLDNGKKLAQLQGQVGHVQQSQQGLKNTLAKIRTNQDDLLSTLGALEKDISKPPQASNHRKALSQNEMRRGQAYEMAEDIDAQLNRMTDSLADTITRINKASEANLDRNNPLTSVVKILNMHMASLQWIDQTANELDQQMGTVRRNLTNKIKDAPRM